MEHDLFDFYSILKMADGYHLAECLPGKVSSPDAFIEANEINILLSGDCLEHIYNTYGSTIGVIRHGYSDPHLMDETFDSRFYFR